MIYDYDVENPLDTSWTLKIKTFVNIEGKITDEWIYHLDRSDKVYKYHHDTTRSISHGQMFANQMFVNTNKIESKLSNDGKIEVVKFYDEYGKLQYTVFIKYDNAHRVIENTIFKPDGSKDNYELSKYDERGNLLMQTDSNHMYIGGLPMQKVGDKIYGRIYRYDKFDKAGNWVQQSYLIGGRFVLCAKREIEYY